MRIEMQLHHWKTALAATLCVLACSQPGPGQVPPPTILEVDVESYVAYFEDTSDVSKFATNPNLTTLVRPRNFEFAVYIRDIVAVNGQPAKGTLTRNVRQALFADTFEILNSDGTPIGTVVAYGAASGSPPPGAPLTQTGGNVAITGGTGAFLGARGQVGEGVASAPVRQASITEDPSNRRKAAGGGGQSLIYLIPMERPEITMTASGPAVTHSRDFSLVTASKPAAAGEILSLFATGLGPVSPGVNPGQPFPSSPLANVNSPVQVTVNGNPAQVIAATGYPGAVNGYQVNFQVPPGTAKGPATVQVSAAWIAGSAVTIPVQ